MRKEKIVSLPHTTLKKKNLGKLKTKRKKAKQLEDTLSDLRRVKNFY